MSSNQGSTEHTQTRRTKRERLLKAVPKSLRNFFKLSRFPSLREAPPNDVVSHLAPAKVQIGNSQVRAPHCTALRALDFTVVRVAGV